MTNLVHPHHAAEAITRLTQAWEFLSGEQRAFVCLNGNTDALQFTEFSFFMPLNTLDTTRHGGVGVLMERADAETVAANMFAIPVLQLRAPDLQDSCSEVCNVLAACVAAQFSDESLVRVGIPKRANAAEYTAVADNSEARAVYQSRSDKTSLFVVLYDRLRDLPVESP